MNRTRSKPKTRGQRFSCPALGNAATLGVRPAITFMLALGLASCTGLNPNLAAEPAQESAPRCSPTVKDRAATENLSHLKFEVKRLREDLQEAESSILAMESGMRGQRSRADSVSAVAEARISVERVSQTVPWRPDIVAEALQKLDEAEHELRADHRSTAFFFASRARRIAETLDAERQRVATTEGTRFVRPLRANLRSGPSTKHPVLEVLGRETPVFSEQPEGEWMLVRTLAGQVGWIHGDLLR